MVADNVGLALLWALRSVHPSAEVREWVVASLDASVSQFSAAEYRPGVLERIAKERGTPWEPFVLDEKDAEEAAELSVIAFSNGAGIRVVSRDKLAPMGGLALRPGLKKARSKAIESVYVERLAEAPDPWPADRAEVRFAPGLVPSSDELAMAVPPTVEAKIGDAGLEVRIGPLASSKAGQSWRQPVRLVGEAASRWWRGVVDEVPDGLQIVIRPDGPEATIEATAWMMERRWLEVPGTKGGPLTSNIWIRLDLPSAPAPVALLAISTIDVAAVDRIEQWIHSPPLDLSTVLTDEVKREVGRWLGMPDGWVSIDLLEGYP